ncbi:MAG: TraR/DksA C4-type zinc finger protein [Actinomycetota bacterium]|nr:TraR/DksA C4-type zinc finger protein [Actinomycetota bacterium]
MPRATTPATKGTKAAKKQGTVPRPARRKKPTPAAAAEQAPPAKAAKAAKAARAAKAAPRKATKKATTATKATKAGKASKASKKATKAVITDTAPSSKGAKAQDKKFLGGQRSALQAERESYVAQADSLKAEADQMAQEAEPGDVQFDEESGEGGTMNIDRERDLALSAQARAAVEDIDLALGKITRGTYGKCERCGQPIPKARLKALPQARLCVACKSGGLSRR